MDSACNIIFCVAAEQRQYYKTGLHLIVKSRTTTIPCPRSKKKCGAQCDCFYQHFFHDRRTAPHTQNCSAVASIGSEGGIHSGFDLLLGWFVSGSDSARIYGAGFDAVAFHPMFFFSASFSSMHYYILPKVLPKALAIFPLPTKMGQNVLLRV
jgi:hypothetical protein